MSFVGQGRAWMFAQLALHNAVPGKTAGWNVGGRRSGQPTCWRTAAWAYRRDKLVALAISLGFGVAILDSHLLNSCQHGQQGAGHGRKDMPFPYRMCRHRRAVCIDAARTMADQNRGWKKYTSPKVPQNCFTVFQCSTASRYYVYELLAVVAHLVEHTALQMSEACAGLAIKKFDTTIPPYV